MSGNTTAPLAPHRVPLVWHRTGACRWGGGGGGGGALLSMYLQPSSGVPVHMAYYPPWIY